MPDQLLTSPCHFHVGLSGEASPGEGNGYPLQYSCLENSVDRGAWWATVHGVAKSRMAGALRYRAWAQSWSSAALAARSVSWASLVAQMVKNPPAVAGDLGSIPGLHPHCLYVSVCL